MLNIKEIQEQLNELGEGLNDLGKVCRDYTFMIVFIDREKLNKRYEDFVKEISNEIQHNKTNGGSDGEQTIADLSEGEDSGIDPPQESGM